jgi:hypothetical protein
MTPEEAVEILKGAIKKPNTKDGYLGQALDMAIKALEQQPCEDCISREAVIRLVEQYPNIIGNRYSGLIADIKQIPSVTPQELILDKIRAEIENHCGLTKENHCRYCSYCNNLMGVREILEIIDKYKAESEE